MHSLFSDQEGDGGTHAVADHDRLVLGLLELQHYRFS